MMLVTSKPAVSQEFDYTAPGVHVKYDGTTTPGFVNFTAEGSSCVLYFQNINDFGVNFLKLDPGTPKALKLPDYFSDPIPVDVYALTEANFKSEPPPIHG